MTEVWTNWARQQRCAPVRIERPASEEELSRAVTRAAGEGLEVRVAGSGHSFTDTACTDGVLIDIGAMDRVLDADASSGLVTVQAGITLHELGARLAELGLAMENQGDIDAQTLAGAISTATHGTGATYRNISSQVEAVRLVTATGEVLDIGAEDPGLLGAARVGLGALGALSAVTLRTVPIFTLERRDAPMPLGAVLDDFDGHADGADHFELYVFPYTDVALTRTSTRSDREPEPGNVRVEVVQERLVENGALAVLGAVTGRLPGSIPRVNRTLIKAMTPSVKVDRSHRVYATRRDVRFTEMEYAIPREHGPEALRRVLETIQRRRLPIAFPIEMRVVRGDDAPLSTAHGRDSVYIAVHQFRGQEFETYFRAVEAIMDSYGGRPHWGKRHYQSAATLRDRYPQWDAWQEARDELDPGRTFTNDYTRRVLGG
ncbi:MAG TPA: D-arabinono-1,4-lactone oxidase [Thermoleophilaceae bacterium]|nr:D-arabinono-1,4-lactone oxidase [Thermoleophilaceae bacterium]